MKKIVLFASMLVFLLSPFFVNTADATPLDCEGIGFEWVVDHWDQYLVVVGDFYAYYYYDPHYVCALPGSPNALPPNDGQAGDSNNT